MPPPTAVIRGHVVAADTGLPLRKAQLRLLSAEVAVGGARENRMATTDADGAYEFKDLPAGRYLLSGSKGSYVGVSFGQQRPTDQAKPIEVVQAQQLERVDLALPRGGVITGRVVDEYGEPMSNVQVGAMRSETTNGQRRLIPSGRVGSTDDLGEFRLFSVPPGQYYVQANWHGMTPAVAPGARAEDATGYSATFFPGTSDASQAQRLTISSGQIISDVVLAMVPIKAARISGTVVDSSGRPAQGMLFVTPDSKDLLANAVGALIQPGGTFAVANLAPGDYTLRAQISGAKPESAVLKVAVAGADLNDLRLMSMPPASVSGRVVVDPAAAQALPSATMTVLAMAVQPMPGLGGSTPGRVADDFTFTVQSPPGLMNFMVMGQPSGFGIRAVRLHGIDITDTGVELEAGRNIDGIEIEITNKLTAVSGLVSDSRGDAAKDYTVVLFAQDQSRWNARSRYMKLGRPDQDGRFKVSALPPGEYYAIALDRVDTANWNDADFLGSIQPQATTFSLMEAETKTLDLRLRSRP